MQIVVVLFCVAGEGVLLRNLHPNWPLPFPSLPNGVTQSISEWGCNILSRLQWSGPPVLPHLPLNKEDRHTRHLTVAGKLLGMDFKLWCPRVTFSVQCPVSVRYLVFI